MIKITPGDRFGRLVVISEAQNKITKSGQNIRAFNMHCDCGTTKIIALASLRHRKTRSCGCLSKRNKNFKHGMSKSPEYRVYMNMISRCRNPNDAAFIDYGGRGITICDRWASQDGFINFIADMGRRPSQKYTIDRINNDSEYSPENCRWATMKEQCNNRRSNTFFEHAGKRMTIAQWTKETGIPHSAIMNRLRDNWTIEKILTTPVRKGNWRKNKHVNEPSFA